MKQAIRLQPIEITTNPPKKTNKIITNILFGCIVFVAFLMILSLLTYHPEDSAWSKTVATSDVKNWLGARGAYFSDILLTTIGRAAWLIPILLMLYAYQLICKRAYKGLEIETIIIRIVGILLMLLSVAGLLEIYTPNVDVIERGGAIGQFIGTLLTHSVGWVQALFPESAISITISKIILFFFLFITTIMASGCGPLVWIDNIGAVIIQCFQAIFNIVSNKPTKTEENGDLANIEHLMEKEDQKSAKNGKQHFLSSLLKPKTKSSKVDVRKTISPSHNPEEIREYFFTDVEANNQEEISIPMQQTDARMEPSFTTESPNTQSTQEPQRKITPATPQYEPQLDEHGQPKIPTIFKRPTINSSPQDDMIDDSNTRFQNLADWANEKTHSKDAQTTAANNGGSIFSHTQSTSDQRNITQPQVQEESEQDFDAFLESLEKYHPPKLSEEIPSQEPTVAVVTEPIIEETPIIHNEADEYENLPSVQMIEEMSLPQMTEITIPEASSHESDKQEPSFDHLASFTMEIDEPLPTWEPLDISLESVHEPELEFISEMPELEPEIIQNIMPEPTEHHVQPNIVIPPAPMPQAMSEGQKAELLKHFPMAGQLPPLSLLGDPPPSYNQYDVAELNDMAQLIEEQLKNFSIKVEVANIEPGPVVTRFELDLAPGVKVAQINNLEKDIARGLSVTSVRVVDIIPGTSYVGLEIPNRKRETVYFKTGLESKEYQESTDPLTLILGKSISGDTVVANLAKMPHLLVAGTTGSGKSVGVNTMLLSMLFKAKPEDLRMILIDPKMLELSVYNDIPHLLIPVITDMKESANALRWCVAEMERRYLLMSQLKVRNIAGFNQKVQEALDAGTPLIDPLWRRSEHVSDTQNPPLLEKLPFIVVVIDEFADMMMLVGKKCEELIARLAQKARASGIHLILATQRPSVDVITGLIKANIPTRIAFQVSSKIDSRTILDQQGAETLLGNGDMLYAPAGLNLPIRVHGAFVDDHEVNKVAEFLKLTGEPDYIEDILQEPTEAIPGLSPEASGVAATPSDEQDPLFDEAVKIVVESRRASISFIQRKLRVGYQRAARLMEEMEELRIVTPPQSNGNREVLMAPENDDY